MPRLYHAIAAAALACGSVFASSAASAQTYPFDSPVVPNNYQYNPTTFTGATFNSKSGVSGLGSPFFQGTPPSGNQAAFIQSVAAGTFDNGQGAISLAFTGLTVGSLYSASFYLATRPGYAVNDLFVSFGGTSLGTYTATGPSFTLFTTPTFRATGTSGSLLFTGAPTTTGDNDVNLDSVTIAGAALPPGAVPEPATWALMIMGFGAVGYALRRRPGRRIAFA